MIRMQRASILSILFMGLSLTAQITWAHTGTATQPIQNDHRSGPQPVAASLLNLPIQFEANQGQVDEQVKFLARGKGYNLFLTPTESVMVLSRQEATVPASESSVTDPLLNMEPAPIKQSVVRMKLEGANPSPAIDGMEQLPGIVNYFIGNDPAKWRTKIPTYAKVHYKDAYPGIDLAYYGNRGKLEYDFIVAPGADPSQIKLAFEGASDITVADSGDLLVTTALGEVRVQKPIVYQLEENGHKTLVAGNYVASPKNLSHVQIHLAAYDREKPLVIDPVLLYSTYLGGNNEDVAQGIAVDGSGQAYVTGHTYSPNFPVLNANQPIFGGGQDAFVTKLTAAGMVAYSTYLGGNAQEIGYGIAVDGNGQAYVTGNTRSPNFPVLNASQPLFGGFEDAFVAKLTAAGTLAYSTYLGGNNRETGYGIAVDGSGQAYVTGETASMNFPLLNASQTLHGGALLDAFVTKLTAVGTVAYSTYLGGNNWDIGKGIAVDGSGQAYVTGYTYSPNFPVLNASQPIFGGGDHDAFVTKLTSAGTVAYSTYLGGSHWDFGQGIAVDGSGQVYVTGATRSPDFPVLNAGQPLYGGGVRDVFVTKLTVAGTLAYSTYLGGSNFDGAQGIALDGSGQAYITGNTTSLDFPLLNASQPTFGGSQDAFVAKLTATGTFAYSTYLGGNSTDVGHGIAVDGSGQTYVTGHTYSPNFPLLNASQLNIGGDVDAFIVKLADKPLANAGPDQPVSMATLVTLDGTGSSGGSLTYNWAHSAGPFVALSGATTAHPTFTAPNVPAAGATVTFELIVCEGTSSNCSEPDTVNVHISNVNQRPVAQAAGPATVQEGSPVILDGTASYDPDMETLTYAWHQVFGTPVTLAYPNTATPSFTAPQVGAGGGSVEFELTVTDPRTLSSLPVRVSISISNVNQPPVAEAGADQTRNEQTLVTLDGSGSQDPDLDGLHYSWTQTAGPSVILTGASTASPTFTAPNVAAGGVVLTFQLIVNDGHISSVADTVQVAVVNVNDPPVCSLAQASPNLLWPPNHAMTQVSIVGLTDPQNQTITITYPNVTQDEPIKGLGDGDTSPDAAVSGNDILLRAERAGTGNGRVYVVHFTATNTDGAHCSGTVNVSVPHDKKDPAVGGAQLYNSFGP